MRSNSSFSNLCTLFLILSIILWGETSSYGQNGITHWKVPLEGKYATSWDTTDWDIRLLIDKPPMHVSIVSADSLRQIKSNNCKTALSSKYEQTIEMPLLMESDTIVKGRHFEANLRDNSVPMDNSMAISTNGHIVSAINSNVVFMNTAGETISSKSLPEFFKLLGLGTRMYDPRVVFDIVLRRFIFMCLHGSEPSNTFLCIAFSATEDPTGEWYYYKIDGNPLEDLRWFDYPNVGISAQYYYVTGLMRNTEGDWQYTVTYQIDKHKGFAGETLNVSHYSDIRNEDNSLAFNIVPALSSDSLVYDEMYFVSNEALGGSKYHIHYLHDTTIIDDTWTGRTIVGQETLLAPDGKQPNTNNVLNTFDSRFWTATRIGNRLHFGSHVRGFQNQSCLQYGYFSLPDLGIASDILEEGVEDRAFPSITPMDDGVLIHYLVSSDTRYPSQEVRQCKVKEGQLQWSSPTVLKEGEDIVDVLSDMFERWGDYTTSCVRYHNNKTENWSVGCFGLRRSYGSWIGEFYKSTLKSANIDFYADRTTISLNEDIVFRPQGQAEYDSIAWYVDGVYQSADSIFRRTFDTLGIYDIEMHYFHQGKIDTILKSDYVFVRNPILAPISDFEVSQDTIFVGDQVQYIDKSIGEVVTFKWSFINGSPNTSSESSPLVTYNKVGTHVTSLTVANIAGSNTKIKTKAVTVINRTIPMAMFTANNRHVMVGDTVVFMDNSSGGPRSREWTFEGGTILSQANGIVAVIYENEGTFGVSLIVSNEWGADTLVQPMYITVGISNASDIMHNEQDITVDVYPNPAVHQQVSIDISSRKNTGHFEVNIITLDGARIKNIFNDRLTTDKTTISFNKDQLTPGIYLLHFKGKEIMPFVKKLLVH